MIARVAMVFGSVFVLAGILGLVATGGMSLAADPAPAMLLGLFPVNLLLNGVHVAFGVWGLRAASALSKAKTYCLVGGLIYLALAFLGLVTPTMLGLMPIWGNNVGLHAVVGIALAGVGFASKAPAVATT